MIDELRVSTPSQSPPGTGEGPRIGIRVLTTIMVILLASIAPAGCGGTASSGPARAENGPRELVVFAAASLTDVMNELERRFESQHPDVDVLMNFGGSSRLATQLLEGAAADLFAPADETQMANVVEAGLVDDGPHLFAGNRLVIVMPADNPAGITQVADLAAPGVSLILAVPGVPIRAYSDQVIAALSEPGMLGSDFAPAVYDNLVSEEENVRQVIAKIALGEADAGLVYSSDVTQDVAADLATVAIPAAVNVTPAYPIARLRDGHAPDLAADFMELLLSVQGQAVLADWGFLPADEGTTGE